MSTRSHLCPPSTALSTLWNSAQPAPAHSACCPGITTLPLILYPAPFPIPCPVPYSTPSHTCPALFSAPNPALLLFHAAEEKVACDLCQLDSSPRRTPPLLSQPIATSGCATDYILWRRATVTTIKHYGCLEAAGCEGCEQVMNDARHFLVIFSPCRGEETKTRRLDATRRTLNYPCS